MRKLTLLFLTSCSSPPPDVVGPFTGRLHRYVIDALTMPPDRLTYADDLDGNGRKNQLGGIVAALAAQDDAAASVPDQLAAGAIAGVLEIASDNLDHDEHSGVRFQGSEGDDGDFVGARIEGGQVSSNRTRYTHHPASMTVRLPVFADADPQDLALVGVEIDLQPDDNGFTGTLRGGLPAAAVTPLLLSGIRQMLNNDPAQHAAAFQLFDADQDGVVTDQEIAGNWVIENLTFPDVKLYDAQGHWHPGAGDLHDALSVGFAFHAVPCDSGRCSTAVPADPCLDRVSDGDESDHDCGGSCPLRCAAGKTCNSDGDCQSENCVAGACS